jgi:hypothetical protein
MINKMYEIVCDYCGSADYGINSIKEAERQYKRVGSLVKGKHHFCGERCYKNWLGDKK